jgi:hypothetical protein
MKSEIRFATAADVERYYNGPQARTIRAVVVESEGDVIAIGGVAYMGNYGLAFMEMQPGAETKKLSIIKATKKAMRELCAKCAPPLIAQQDETLPTSERYLRHFGFKPLYDDYYIWGG